MDTAMEQSFGEISGAQGEGGLGEPEEGGEAQDSDDCMSGESDDNGDEIEQEEEDLWDAFEADDKIDSD